MSADWQIVLTIAGLVAAAVSGGAFFAFSNFVMPALAELPPRDGVSAMQEINTAAPSPAFVTAIVGAGLVGIPVAIAELDRIGETSVRLVTAGAALSLASFLITMAFNVPRNDALGRLDAAGAPAEAYWARYLSSWTRANTVRTLTSLASVACYALSLRAW